MKLRIQGPGMQSGRPVQVEVISRNPGEGRRIILAGRQIPVRPEHLSCALRCSQCDEVGPLEHLAAAFLLAGHGDWELRCDEADLPLGDGSAAFPGAESMPDAVLVRAVERPALKLSNARGGWLSARPAECFHVRSRWLTMGREEIWEGGLERLPECLPARTFVDAETYCRARAQGLLGGCGPGQGRLLGPAGSDAARLLAGKLGISPDAAVWTGGKPRMAGECAAHKVLDLVGDLALWLGFLPCWEIEMSGVGHAQFHELGRHLGG